MARSKARFGGLRERVIDRDHQQCRHTGVELSFSGTKGPALAFPDDPLFEDAWGGRVFVIAASSGRLLATTQGGCLLLKIQ